MYFFIFETVSKTCCERNNFFTSIIVLISFKADFGKKRVEMIEYHFYLFVF